MRGNRRYVMSRSARRNPVPPPYPSDDGNSTPSVDTDFLRKLIHTGDTNFIDELVGKQGAEDEDRFDEHDNEFTSKYSKGQRKWPYVLLGMVIMYVMLFLWEARKTSNWWKNTYMVNLKSSQSTSYDSMAASADKKGAVYQTGEEVARSNQQQPSQLFKSAAWQQGGSMGGFSNNQQQQLQLPQYPQNAGMYAQPSGQFSQQLNGVQSNSVGMSGGASRKLNGGSININQNQQHYLQNAGGGLRSFSGGGLSGGSNSMNVGLSLGNAGGGNAPILANSGKTNQGYSQINSLFQSSNGNRPIGLSGMNYKQTPGGEFISL